VDQAVRGRPSGFTDDCLEINGPPPCVRWAVVMCGSATLDVLGSQYPVHILGPKPRQLVLTPAGPAAQSVR
jgi:16S rRNA C967 or C1407 C5-methylase (RsmB/RsmF family)